MQGEVERALKQFPEVEEVVARIGNGRGRHGSNATQYLGYICVCLKIKVSGRLKSKSKSELVEEMEEVLEDIPGNAYEFSQPIELRFNELISGVRSDLAVKVYGDDLDTLVDSAKSIAAAINNVSGAADVNVEQVTGLPILSIVPKRSLLDRYGLSVG